MIIANQAVFEDRTLQCKMFFQEKILIKAHIFPEGINKIIKGQEKNLINVDSEGHWFLRQTNTWDKNILCAECDNKLGSYEKYGVQIIKKIYQSKKRYIIWDPNQNQEVPFLEIDIDLERFRLFILCVFYKASLSQKFEFFNLGKYEDVFRRWLETGRITDPKLVEFVMFGLLKHKEELDKVMSDSISKTKDKQIHLYRIFLPGVILFVKIGKKEIPSDLKQYILFDEQHLKVPLIPIEQTPLYNEMLGRIEEVEKRKKRIKLLKN